MIKCSLHRGKSLKLHILTTKQSALSEHSPASAQALKDLFLQFMWEQVCVPDLQRELRTIFDRNECLQHPGILSKISPFLQAEMKTAGDEVKAREVMCDCYGVVTQKGGPDRQAKLEEGVKFMGDQDVSCDEWKSTISDYSKKEMITCMTKTLQGSA